MGWFLHIWNRFLLALVLAATCISAPVESFAQTRNCAQLARTQQSLARNSEYRNLARNRDTARTLANNLAQIERAFVQQGCQQALNAGQNLNRVCRNAASQINRGRSNLADLQRQIQTGQSAAAQIDQISQQLVIMACGGGSRSTANVRTREGPQNFFEQLFDALTGSGFGGFIEPDYGYQNMDTVRSVCVRQSDGYYWPVSFSTVFDYLPSDALQCQSQCPGADVELYYYSNPGQEPKDMINLNGQPYSALPNAFAYRTEFRRDTSCSVPLQIGTIEIETIFGQARPVIIMDGLHVPLPLRDPRRAVETVIAVAVHVMLPRPRPRLSVNGEAALPVESAGLRLVEVGGRVVRLVGPETPYAPLVAGES